MAPSKVSAEKPSSLERGITLREAAKQLGISYSRIMRLLDETENIGNTVEIKRGKPTVLKDWQVTYIKEELSKGE